MRPWLTCIAIFLAATSNVAAGASIDARDAWPNTVAVTSDEQRLLDDALDGRWDQYTLLAAALIASGADQQQQAKATLNYERLKSAIAESISPNDAPRNRAAALLRYLHHGVLRGGYDLRATAIHDCLVGGRFNCVSATVLFNCLAAEIGLQVQTLGYPNHARSVVIADGRAIEVETTCADWFYRPQEDVPPDSQAANLATVAHGNPRPLTDVALVAMIYYNRAVEASRDHDYQAAIRLNRLALALDPAHALARANLYSAINNHALATCHAEQFESAIGLIRLGLALNPNHHPFHDNLVYVYHRWLENLAGRNELNAAPPRARRCTARRPSAALWKNWRQRLTTHF